MIRIDHLCLSLGGRRVLEQASLALQPGRVTAILGPNGAGKTSLLRAIAGLVTVESGSVVLCRGVEETAIAALRDQQRARIIGYLPQNGAPAWPVSVRELVALGRMPHQSGFAALSPADERAIDAALAATDMAALAGRSVETLSGGEKARAKFARVLAGDPEWILADEPLANLDPPHARDVEHLMRTAAQAGKGVVVVLHQLNAALRLADDVVLLKAGRVLAAGAAEAVLTPVMLEQAFGMAFRLIEDEKGKALVPIASPY